MCVFQHGQSRTDRKALFLKVSAGCQTRRQVPFQQFIHKHLLARHCHCWEHFDLRRHFSDFGYVIIIILHEMKADGQYETLVLVWICFS